MRGQCRSAVALVTVAFAISLTACGGGGGGGDEEEETGAVWTAPPAVPGAPPAGATVDGVFRDAVVQGLGYSSGGLSGTTGADGRFQYQQGTPIAFTIGAVALGSGTGQLFMTPMNILPNSTNVSQQIDNRLRLLQMLDTDGNPENGILISEAVRAAAAGWTTPDFTASYTAFATAVAPLVTAASNADGTPHTLPSETVAREHFFRTYWCAYSGLFRGTYGGADSGVFAIVAYGNGQLFGMAHSNIDRDGVLVEKTNATTQISILPSFVAGITSNGGSFTGQFSTVDTLSGTWTSTPDTGTFSGLRSIASAGAVYRIAGYQFPVGTALLMQFEINATNQVSGAIIDVDSDGTGEPVSLTGTLSGTTFTAAAAGNRYTVNGTFDPNAAPTSRRLTGTLNDTAKNRNVQLNLGGCRLN